MSFFPTASRKTSSSLPNAALINAIVDQLAAGQPLPDKNRDHALTGDSIGFRECHIRPNWLLVYRVDGEDLILFLFRTGSHTDLFD